LVSDATVNAVAPRMPSSNGTGDQAGDAKWPMAMPAMMRGANPVHALIPL
jgi:hypothetical protein